MTRDRHASRASFACVRCKKDKRRCDISQILSAGDRPEQSCTACRNKNEKCEVRYGEDKRSQRQPNETKVLQRRMQALEEFVKTVAKADGKVPAPSRDNIDADCVLEQAQQAFDDFQRSRIRAFPSPVSSSSPNAHMTTISISPPEEQQTWTSTSHDEPTTASLRSVSFSGQNRPKVDGLTPNSLRSSSFSAPSRPDFDMISDDFPAALDETASPSSMHDFDQFLGSASLFPYSESAGNATNMKPGVCHSEKEASLRSRMALETFPEPEPIVTYLLDLFWQWQSSYLLVVDRDLFLRHRQIWDESDGHGDRDFYSPCLLYALLALASMISLDRGVTRYSASPDGVVGEGFAKRARALLDLELDHPKITTVQAALVLGCRYGSMKDNSLGWMYSGIAFRMASKLGLHLDQTKAVASGQMTSEMAELRRRVFWGCHIEDNLHFYFALILLHRPFLRFPREPNDSRNNNVEPSQSSTTCATAAANITKLLSNYKRSYNIRQLPPSAVHFIFIAGSIHLVNLRSTKLESHNTLLQSSLEALSEIGKSYPVAQMAALELEGLTEKWKSSNMPETAKPISGQRRPEENINVGLDNDGKVDSSHALPNFLDVNFSPLKELDGYFDSWNSQQPTVDFDYGYMDLGQAGAERALDPGMGWMSHADFGGIEGGTYPWLYN
ncbi:putative transcriptional regulatory protein [Colletotrichum higginsianum]|uniref:Putative transcriptional regulatory protein n=1 Tax=Colletotrichum higginsianum TaxID=80884 RepID=A0A4T0VPE5_9PEZI|nr:putative transcriptional regulatory protein [Colletotrichum higginsianum]